MAIELDPSADEFLADKGFDPKFGARPLKRAIQKYIEDPLAEEMLLGTFEEGTKIIVKHKKDADELYFVGEPLESSSSKNKQEKDEPETKHLDE